jgi:hypothetical protein
MKYVLENQMAFDSNELGFPSIDGCHALTLHTSTGLYGFHIYGTAKHYHTYTNADLWERKGGALKDFLTGHHASGKPIGLYSACHHSRRGYSGKDTWKAEVKVYANAYGFKGKVHCLNLDQMQYNGSAYVEYRRIGTNVYLYCKSWTEMQSATSKSHGGIDPNMKTAGDGVSVQLTNKDSVTTSVSKKSGNDMHRVTDAEMSRVRV